MVPSLSPGGNNVFSSRTSPKQILVGTANGVFLLERESGANEWRIAYRSLPDHHVHVLLCEPSSGLIFAGIHKGTVYASRDLGESWEPRDRGITEPDIYTLNALNLNGQVRLFAGTEPARLFLSDNLGVSWREIETLRSVPSAPRWHYPQPPYIAHVKQIVFHPEDSGTIYVCIEQGALLRSRDGGESWQELHGFYEDVHRLAILRSDPRKMYLACGDGLYTSTDAGSSWDRLTSRSCRIGYPDGLVVHPQREKLVFISGAGTIPPTWSKHGTANAAIGRSRDGGLTWTFLTNGFPTNFNGNVEALAMVASNSSYFLFAGTTEGDVLFSGDEGENWMPIACALPPIAKRRHHLYLKPARAVG